MTTQTATVEQALAAMDEAGHAARAVQPKSHLLPGWVIRWAQDRLRLIERDRATLQRHRPGMRLVHRDGSCQDGNYHAPWPCPDARAVIDYWTG